MRLSDRRIRKFMKVDTDVCEGKFGKKLPNSLCAGPYRGNMPLKWCMGRAASRENSSLLNSAAVPQAQLAGCRGNRNGFAPAELIQKSKEAFGENEAEGMLSAAEFLYWQGRYVRKFWWFLQGGILLILWGLLRVSDSGFYTQRCMGAAAPLFAVLLLPELWKNRNGGSVEIECAAYYSLRQIYAARMLLFAIVDFLLLWGFSLAMVLKGRVFVSELAVHFFLPYLLTCCICFRTLYSRMASEALALVLCMVWCVVWNQLVLNEKVYAAISPAVWYAMLVTSALYLGYCIYKGQKNVTIEQIYACGPSVERKF